MKQLWAPWRMEFIAEAPKHGDCVFCGLLRAGENEKTLILHRDSRVFAVLNKYPYNNGHLMVVPNAHVADFTQLEDDDLVALSRLAKASVRILKEVYKPEGFNLGMNLGTSAGAGIKDHLHLHIVPRWLGDTNFMPVLADTKSMPQHLSASYRELVDHFGRL